MESIHEEILELPEDVVEASPGLAFDIGRYGSASRHDCPRLFKSF